jgi:hypothetical protein
MSEVIQAFESLHALPKCLARSVLKMACFWNEGPHLLIKTVVKLDALTKRPAR